MFNTRLRWRILKTLMALYIQLSLRKILYIPNVALKWLNNARFYGSIGEMFDVYKKK